MKAYTPDAKLFQDFWQLPENPFPFLGADEYPEEQILSLFEIDRDSTIKAFSLQNSIIEGSYGTGKTMLLKAIYAFNYSKMILDFAERYQSLVVPVYIKFSDLPYGTTDIYKEMILYVYKKILDTRVVMTSFIKDTSWFNKFRIWLNRLTSTGIFSEDKRYAQLSAETVTKRVKDIFKGEGCAGFDWIQKLGVAYEKNYEKEIVRKPNPSITDLENLFDRYFASVCKRILLLIDEVDRLPNSAFEKQGNEKYSIYEIFLNQLRTSKFLFYKIAVYPKTKSSEQVEGSRIGARIKLGFDIKDHDDSIIARDFFYRILRSYLSYCAKKLISPEKYFIIHYPDAPAKYPKRIKTVDAIARGDSLEQLIDGSGGVIRRFIKLAGDSMIEAANKKPPRTTVSKYDVFDAMRIFGRNS